MDAALAYYTDSLGFQVAVAFPDHDYAIVERDAVALHLFLDRDRNHSSSSLHIFTDGLEDLFAELQGRGVKIDQGIVRQPWGNRDFRISDPSGNEIKFTEPLQES